MLLLSSPKTIPKSSTDRPQSRIITRSYTLDDQSFEDYPHFSPKIVRRSSVRSSRSSERDHRLPELEPIDAKKHQHRHHHLNHASDNPTAPSITPDVLPRNTPSRRKRRPSTSSVTSTASSALLPTPTSSYFAPQPESLGLEVRSPFSKRAPASRSSHGIETSSGPPPALSTQRSYTAEASRNGYVSTQQQPLNPRTEAGTLLVNANGIGSGDCGFECREIAKPNCEGSVDASSRQRSFSIGQPINRMDRTRVDAWARDDGDATIRGIDSVHMGNDDLFLRLARSNTTSQGAGDVAARSERRKSRIELNNHRQTLSTNELTPSGARPSSSGRSFESRGSTSFQARPATSDGWDRQQHSASSQAGSPKPEFRFLSRDRPSATSRNHPQIDNRSRPQGVTHHNSPSAANTASNRSASPERHNEREILTAKSTSASMHAPSYRQSNLSYSTLRNGESAALPSSNALTTGDESSRETPRADDTESTASTTAPSTVWDELDDLKSRIRKLELTGKLPTTSGEAVSNGSGERPHTATTTVTTISSSPKHRRANSSSPSRSVVGGTAAANIHPLLHASLAKAKPLIGSEAYRALEATASDALSLAIIMGSGGPQGTLSSAATVVGGTSLSERQIRRKADSMCRGLTELCIALCDIKTESASTPARALAAPPAPVHDSSTSPNHQPQDLPNYRRSLLESQDPDPSTLTRSGSRALSRLEARRSSMLALNSPSTAHSPLSELSTPTQDNPTRPKRHSLAPTFLPRHRVLTQEQEEENNNEDNNSPLRAPSRAMTSINHQPRNSPRAPREYTSRHPLPIQTPPPSTQQPNNLQPRRHHLSSSFSNSPQLPASSPLIQNGNARRYLDRSTPPISERTVSDRNLTSSATVGNDEQDINFPEERERRRIGSLPAGYSMNGRTMGDEGLRRNGSVVRRS